jgi:hypothetical protein
LLDIDGDIAQDVARRRHDALREWVIVGDPGLRFDAGDAKQGAPRLAGLRAAIHHDRFAKVPAQITDSNCDHGVNNGMAAAQDGFEAAPIMKRST